MTKTNAVMIVSVTWMWTAYFIARVEAENWNQFRGPHAGIIGQAKLPTAWSADQNVVWKVRLPGVAWSQPVVWDERIFVTTAEAADQPKPDPNNRGPGVSGFAMLFGGASQEPPKTS
jgi:hypothetical protein